MRKWAWGWLLLAAAVPTSAQDRAAASWVGEYTMSQMEAVAGLKLAADGTFQYGLSVGSLDERAQGRWAVSGDHIVLTSDPRPTPPTVVAAGVEANPGQPFSLRLVGPRGSDVPGVDLRIDFATGDPIESYVAGGPWSLPEGETRAPRTVTFSMRSYRLQSPPLPLDARAGQVAMFRLVPNDFGVADLTGARVVREGETLILQREEGQMRFRRVSR